MPRSYMSWSLLTPARGTKQFSLLASHEPLTFEDPGWNEIIRGELPDKPDPWTKCNALNSTFRFQTAVRPWQYLKFVAHTYLELGSGLEYLGIVGPWASSDTIKVLWRRWYLGFLPHPNILFFLFISLQWSWWLFFAWLTLHLSWTQLVLTQRLLLIA